MRRRCFPNRHPHHRTDLGLEQRPELPPDGKQLVVTDEDNGTLRAIDPSGEAGATSATAETPPGRVASKRGGIEAES